MDVYIKKGVPYELKFPMLNAASPNYFISGETVSAWAFSKETSSAWVTLTLSASVTEIASGYGFYSLMMSSAEANHDEFAIKFSSANACDTGFTLKAKAIDFNDINTVLPTSGTLSVFNQDINAVTIYGLAATAFNEVKSAVNVEIAAAMLLFPSGAVVSDGSNTAVTFKTNLSETETDHWKDVWCTFTGTADTLYGQAKKITGYNGTTKFITVQGGYSSAPTSGNAFILINR